MNYASPDLNKYFDTETIMSSKDSRHHGDSTSMTSSNSSDTSVNFSSQAVTPRVRASQTTHRSNPESRRRRRSPESQITPQVVNVTRCSVCSIL